jgi:hypothetical protein
MSKLIKYLLCRILFLNAGGRSEATRSDPYTLYEMDGFKDGFDLDHWFRAERELALQDLSLSVERGAVSARIAMAQFAGPALIISVSGWDCPASAC